MSYLNEWFTQFREYQNSQAGLFVPHDRGYNELPKRRPIKLDINDLVRCEYVVIVIQKMSFAVSTNELFSITVEDIRCENLKSVPKRVVSLVRFSKSKEPVSLISIAGINYSIKDIANGSLDGLGFSYEPAGNCLTFFIRNFSYESVRRGGSVMDDDLFPSNNVYDPFRYIRCRTAIHIPDLGFEDNPLKKNPNYLIKEDIVGLTFTLVFNPETHSLEKITAMVGKIGVTISGTDISELFKLIGELGTLYSDEKKRMMSELKHNIFVEQRFNEIDNLIKHMKIERPHSKNTLGSIRNLKAFEEEDDTSSHEGKQPYPRYRRNNKTIFSTSIQGIGLSLAKNQEVKLSLLPA